MDLRTYLMIKQADIVLKRKDGTVFPSNGTATFNPEVFGDNINRADTRPDIALTAAYQKAQDDLKQRLSTNGAPAPKAIQDLLGPKGVVPMGDNRMTFGKQPTKVIPGIGPTPIGLDYGK